MHHRHLLPNEIDLLIDGETGFGVQPLRDHVASCEDCRARVREARELVTALSQVPLLAPRFGFADRVMTQVPVFVPWHVSARDTVRRWMPETPVARVLAATLVAVVGTLITGLTVWAVVRGDVLTAMTVVVGEQARASFVDALGSLVLAILGPQVVGAVQQLGPIGIGFAAAGFVVASLATILGLRSIASSARSRS